jgi:hypothetical protein
MWLIINYPRNIQVIVAVQSAQLEVRAPVMNDIVSWISDDTEIGVELTVASYSSAALHDRTDARQET